MLFPRPTPEEACTSVFGNVHWSLTQFQEMNASAHVARRGQSGSTTVVPHNHHRRRSIWSRLSQNSLPTFDTSSIRSLLEEAEFDDEVAREEREFPSTQKVDDNHRAERTSSRTQEASNSSCDKDGDKDVGGGEVEIQIDPGLLFGFQENLPISLKHVVPKTKAPLDLLRRPHRPKKPLVTTAATAAGAGPELARSPTPPSLQDILRERRVVDDNQENNFNRDKESQPRRSELDNDAILTCTQFVGPMLRSPLVTPIVRRSLHPRFHFNSKCLSSTQTNLHGGAESRNTTTSGEKSNQLVSQSKSEEPQVQKDQQVEHENCQVPDRAAQIRTSAQKSHTKPEEPRSPPTTDTTRACNNLSSQGASQSIPQVSNSNSSSSSRLGGNELEEDTTCDDDVRILAVTRPSRIEIEPADLRLQTSKPVNRSRFGITISKRRFSEQQESHQTSLFSRVVDQELDQNSVQSQVPHTDKVVNATSKKSRHKKRVTRSSKFETSRGTRLKLESTRYVGFSVWGNYKMVKHGQFKDILNKTHPRHNLSPEQVKKMMLKTNNFLEDFFGKLCNDTDQCYGFFTFHHLKSLLINQQLIDMNTTDIGFMRIMKNMIPREKWKKCEGIIYPDRMTGPEIGTDRYLWD